MFKILFNEKSNADIHLTLTLDNFSFSASIESINLSGYDMIEQLVSYNSYALVDDNVKVKVYREIHNSDCKFLDLNRLGIATHFDFADIIFLYGKGDFLQLDTGIFENRQKDIVLRVFMGKPENTKINSDIPFEVGTFNSDDLVNGNHPRENLWDSYALAIHGQEEWKANKKGIFVAEPTSVIIPADQEYVDFDIIKYKGQFENELDRDIDDEEVFVSSSAGLVTNRRVPLEKGHGSFRLYLFGHTGPIKIKLGRRWYRVWNEYNLLVSPK